MKLNASLVGYTTVGTNNIKKAKFFYDALFKNIEGVYSFKANDRAYIWANENGNSIFGVCKPYDENPASSGNGSMVGFSFDSKNMVDELHSKALSLGGADEGAPGYRDDSFYGAYIRDIDGNKLVFYYYDEN